jgi:hypothetical protein
MSKFRIEDRAFEHRRYDFAFVPLAAVVSDLGEGAFAGLSAL